MMVNDNVLAESVWPYLQRSSCEEIADGNVTDKEEDNHEIGIDCSADERCKKKNRGSQMADENTELHGTISGLSQSSRRPTCHPFILKHVTFSSAGDFVRYAARTR